jgi:G3E family GTPase
MTGHVPAPASGPVASTRVPVTVLTGFLGSGKTTLVNALLRLPDLAGTAVIVNEFGAVGIDHDLVAQSSEDTVLLANGCMCCAVRGDLVEALRALGERGDVGGRPLRQVLIETSGLADPKPILRTLMGEPAVRDRFALAGVVCAVDAILGMDTLDRYDEAVEQAAVADHLFITKTDLCGGDVPKSLVDRLEALNATAELQADRAGQPEALRQVMMSDAADSPRYRPVRSGAADPFAPARHTANVTSFVLTRDEPLPREGFMAWLDMVVASRGAELLRVKGLVNLAEDPEHPLVIHGVQHLFSAPETLSAWPGADRRTRIVFITRGVDPAALDETLSVLARRHRRRSQ